MNGHDTDGIGAYVGLKALSYIALALLALAIGYAAWAMFTYWPEIRV